MNKEKAIEDACINNPHGIRHEWRQKFKYSHYRNGLVNCGYYCVHCLIEIEDE